MTTREASVVAMDVREFKTFRELIHRKTGIWLRDGKQAMLAARLSKRLRHHGMNDFAAYAAYVEKVQDGGKELAEIINCVTTNKYCSTFCEGQAGTPDIECECGHPACASK